MTYDLALKVVKSETPEQTAERIVELYEVITELIDAAIEKIINTPDEEILAEVKAKYGNSEHVANIMRKIITKAKGE